MARAEARSPGFVNVRWSDAAWDLLLGEMAERASTLAAEGEELTGLPGLPARPSWQRALHRCDSLERMAAREHAREALPGPVRLASVEGELERGLRVQLRLLETVPSLLDATARPDRSGGRRARAALEDSVERLCARLSRLYEGFPLLRGSPEAVTTTRMVFRGTRDAVRVSIKAFEGWNGLDA